MSVPTGRPRRRSSAVKGRGEIAGSEADADADAGAGRGVALPPCQAGAWPLHPASARTRRAALRMKVTLAEGALEDQHELVLRGAAAVRRAHAPAAVALDRRHDRGEELAGERRDLLRPGAAVVVTL